MRSSLPSGRTEWRRARRALQVLIADPERTDQVFEIIQALTGKSFERNFRRFAAHPDGRRLLEKRPSLLAALSDRKRLLEMPEGSLGRTYGEFMEQARLSAEGLLEAQQQLPEDRRADLDDERRYYSDRVRDMHDLWHVVSGYGRDLAGEDALLAFTHGQIPNKGVLLIALAGAWIGPKGNGLAWQRYLFRAWRRGRRTSPLSVAPWEDLLPLPLEDVRRRLRVPPIPEAHPQGVWVFHPATDSFTRASDGGLFAAP